MAKYVQVPVSSNIIELFTDDKQYNRCLLKHEGFDNFIENHQQLIDILSDGKTVIYKQVETIHSCIQVDERGMVLNTRVNEQLMLSTIVDDLSSIILLDDHKYVYSDYHSILIKIYDVMGIDKNQYINHANIEMLLDIDNNYCYNNNYWCLLGKRLIKNIINDNDNDNEFFLLVQCDDTNNLNCLV